MKLSYQHLVNQIPSKPSIEDISDNLFQLGHENEIDGQIIDIEITPNRGDCLSLDGILRDLNIFYSIDFKRDLYEGELQPFLFEFENLAPKDCSKISFMMIEIEQNCTNYNGELRNYFKDLKGNKNNFFTDISNFISYETGQPIHCYDASSIEGLSLEYINKKQKFETLLDQKIELQENDLVFKSKNKVSNLAGIVGSKDTACQIDTKSVIIECAHFNPEAIIGKSIKYDIKSDAAHKFERGVDFDCHEKVLRRFAKIVENHSPIKKIEIFSETYKHLKSNIIKLDYKRINKILGININLEDCENHLVKLGFKISNNNITVPSYRNDIETINDIAEEIARVIGYDNIDNSNFNILFNKNTSVNNSVESTLRRVLHDNGFSEVINSPFVSNQNEKTSIQVDNPLDSNRKFLRTSLKESLISNLLFNERRQKDCIKFYEISDIYSLHDELKVEKFVGIIASGRIGKNYKDFSKKIDADWLNFILKKHFSEKDFHISYISRDNIDTKLSTKICYVEFKIELLEKNLKAREVKLPNNYIKYEPVSEFPCSIRDLSFSIKNAEDYYELQNKILHFKHHLIKEVFIFDFFENKKNNEIKLGFRFIFQSNQQTITELEVNQIVSDIIETATKINTVKIPGL
jgi:phenylalanyl-tRNA synthetase beta chain